MLERKIAVIGLGYVGLPLAAAFAQHARVIGFDINPQRLYDLKQGYDATAEVSSEQLLNTRLFLTDKPDDLKSADFYILTLPTPLDEAHKPCLQFLYNGCQLVGQVLKRGDIVVIESTVYPGAVQEECVSLLERFSGLKASADFGVGYSPERINTGDKVHSLANVTKVISALDTDTLEVLERVYGRVASKLYRAPSIKVAEAAKVIENTQRDLNIALMNELALIFEKMGIDTHDVIECAKTKWNFSHYVPGLVGGHCIGVDPYYLTYKAKQLGYRPEVILAGRRINDGMGKHIAGETVKKLILKGTSILGARVALLGVTFKENCRDLRNSKVMDVLHELQSYGVETLVHDPIACPGEAQRELGISLYDWSDIVNVDAIVLCVAHQDYITLSPREFDEKLNHNKLIMDIKSVLDRETYAALGIDLWRL